MRQQLAAGALFLTAATLTTAQQWGPPSGNGGDYSGGNPYSGANNPYTNGGDSNGGNSGSPFGSFGGFDSIRAQVFTRYNGMVTAHAVLATLAFGLIFPSGGILIRLASFPRLWLVHGLVQLLAYFFYLAAFALGVYMATHARMIGETHPIVGIVVFLLIIFQPVLGFVHHLAFKKYARRTVWSYAHLWSGRVAITLGIVNGGLGLQLSQKTRIFSPSRGAVIGYAVAAGTMWLLYVASAIIGERRRSRQGAANAEAAPPKYTSDPKGDSESEIGRPVQYA